MGYEQHQWCIRCGKEESQMLISQCKRVLTPNLPWMIIIRVIIIIIILILGKKLGDEAKKKPHYKRFTN